MTGKRIKAWCDDSGLISFGYRIPTNAHPISEGGPEEMTIVRRRAHKDGGSYWVSGIRDVRDWKDRIEAFCDVCMEHLDDGIPMYTQEEWDALKRRIEKAKVALNSNGETNQHPACHPCGQSSSFQLDRA